MTHPNPHTRHQDERQTRRRLVCESVACEFGGEKWKAFLTDVSSSGAFLESIHQPPIGGHVQVDFNLLFQDRGIRVRFQLRGVVVRVQLAEEHESVLYAQGFSVRFLELTAKEKLCLKAYANQEKSGRSLAMPRPKTKVAQTRP